MTLQTALRQAIRRAASIRALAAEAGVSHVMLWGILHGYEKASPNVARKLARALERRASRSARDARRYEAEAARIRAALRGFKHSRPPE